MLKIKFSFMNGMISNKPHKAADPLDTIIRIKNILHSLSLSTIDRFFDNSGEGFYSCRSTILFDYEEYLNDPIGTNGKGVTKEYALASSLAEFMERLQNYKLFSYLRYATREYLDTLDKNSLYKSRILQEGLELGFRIAPDEVKINTNNLDKLPIEVLSSLTQKENLTDISSFLKNLFEEELLCVPFANLTKNRVDYLPIDLLLLSMTSNGMCAGNTAEEAIVQGICEVFERYAIKRIYFSDVVPPEIPKEYFAGTEIYEHITWLEDQDIKVIVKDCSLGIGLPVIGVVLVDQKSCKYAVKLGADPNYLIALERCFTELFQGEMHPKLTDLDFTSFSNTKCINEQFDKTTVNGTGTWPNSIFNKNASYKFQKFTYSSIDDKSDFHYLSSLINSFGTSLYVRDVSFLNFPSFFVYIPGMSELENPEKFKELLSRSKKLSLINNIKNTKGSDLGSIAEIIEENDFSLRNLYNYNTSKELSIDVNLFLFGLYLSDDNYTKALIFIQKYLDELPQEDVDYQYIFVIKEVLKFKIQGTHENEMKSLLKEVFDHSLVNEVMTDFLENKNIFKNYQFPSCFNCETCEIVDDCKFFDVLKIAKKLERRYKGNCKDQNQLLEYFKELNIQTV